MYRLEWIEQRKLRAATASRTDRRALSPVVWQLGATSFFTDISAEMVNSLLPVYAVLYLRLNPLQYGALDGIYNGIAVALVSLTAGVLADRSRRHKEVAVFGYGLSAFCKLLLMMAGSAWGTIAAVLALDRAGKGTRTAPRDALISLSTPRESLASAFAAHRAMDAGGALLGPVVAFTLLAWFPGRFDVIWVFSFAFALVGLSVLTLFTRNPTATATATAPSPAAPPQLWRLVRRGSLDRRFWLLTGAGSLLATTTMSDGFVYLMLQQRGAVSASFFPLFYVVTAAWYMVMAVPAGRLADRAGRLTVFISGYLALAALYAVLLFSPRIGAAEGVACLFLLGLYYAATEGVLAAMASSVIPSDTRASGLAMLATIVSLGKMASSLLFGFVWYQWGADAALAGFAIGLAVAVPLVVGALRGRVDAAAA